MRTWTRNEKLTGATVIIAALAILAAFVVPEVRRFLHLDGTSDNVQLRTARPGTPAIVAQPNSEAQPKVSGVTASNVEELRQRNEVTRIRETESGETLSEIPAGSFGFAFPGDFLRAPEKIELMPHGGSLSFEVHKLVDGHAEVISYVGSETRDRLRRGLGKGEKLTLYSTAWKEAPNVVAIKVDSIKCDRTRSVEPDNSDRKQPRSLSAVDCHAE